MSNYETLLICLGAQKAGTTWLWRYLREHPQCAATPLKEVHFFDGRPERLPRLLMENRQEAAAAESPEDIGFLEEKRIFIEHAIGLVDQGERTAEAFETLVSSIATPGTKVVAEFTPANGKLAAPKLKKLADLPIQPKFVLILRDPVDRLWSQIRMLARRQATDSNDAHSVALDILARFEAGLDDALPKRSDYAAMLRRAKKAIPPERLFVDFFESFISQPRIDAFCDFLGIDHHPARLDEPRAVGIDIPLAPDVRIRLRDRLMEQYEAVEKELGTLPERWRETLRL